MFQKVKQMCRKAKGFIQGVSTKVKMLALTLFSGTTAMAQSTAGDYSAGTTALSTVAEEIVKYVPVMVKLCYAIAGVVAIIGAISVYIAMNNEEQDVKNILVLQNWLERIRKEVTNKVLSIKRISDFLIFPILAQPTLKKI
ncbi:MAG: DUF4134 domain-containing protein [Butyricimonas virosa]|jgi:hypothetical protein|uniref:DUF4134 domain-containing protein n=1 Tax=Bacteroidales TaxID=171549 RepID=UPI0021CE3F72|nr:MULTISPECIES: DUF4134 domain-containing protein [Bacteroidales]MCI7348427.1 DUF4134 domain-containing protein [Bacteroides stercoris]MCU4241166.1 DUF4134 domain-containing protein [Bacteroides xylanisolvens]MDY4904777.1 DUF4134 domain-containing protein [Butyricimonas virosa]